ncbi:MAG: hypothetical protein IJ955_08165 [Oscillospiraceae bacterium]|nr:hypothetical protein [Oscillospiraceae bacterium]
MKYREFLTLLLSVCLLLSACTPQQKPAPQPPSDNQQQETPVAPSSPPSDATSEPIPPLTNTLEQLTMELVLEWEQADALLSQLNDLEYELQSALEESGYPIEQLTLTISTAGGFTAQSLAQGGIDVAILPAPDFISYEAEITPIAISSEELCENVVAVSNANEHLDQAFQDALFHALTDTATGQNFLSVCCPDVVFSTVSSDALQAVRDTLAEQEQTGGDHE